MPYHDSEAMIAHSPYVMKIPRSVEDDRDRSDFINNLTLKLNRTCNWPRNCVDSPQLPAVESTEEIQHQYEDHDRVG